MYGSHKKDWAKARRTSRRRYPYSRDDEEDSMESPLIITARTGNVTAAEWLLSDTPSRLYKEFGAANKDDNRIAAFSKARGGFEKAVDDWLNHNRTLYPCSRDIPLLSSY